MREREKPLDYTIVAVWLLSELVDIYVHGSERNYFAFRALKAVLVLVIITTLLKHYRFVWG